MNKKTREKLFVWALLLMFNCTFIIGLIWLISQFALEFNFYIAGIITVFMHIFIGVIFSNKIIRDDIMSNDDN